MLSAKIILEPFVLFESEIGADVNVDKPFLLKNCPAVAAWVDDPVVQQVMSQYGGDYKKKAKENKHSAPLGAKQGKEPTEAMFGKIASPMQGLMDLTPISQSWMSTSWMFGMTPEYHCVTLCPSSCSMLRVLWMGTMSITAFQQSTVKTVAVANVAGQSVDTIDNLLGYLSADHTPEIWKSMKGIKVTLNPQELLYIPTGWVLAERSHCGPLIFGARKSSFYKTEVARDNYKLAKDLITIGKPGAMWDRRCRASPQEEIISGGRF